ncbi:MAG: hypothetical protein MK180_10685 [Rhodobacteraceae bacterium]|nr:hypothetical protein [Paracoccaceae bacterium]
MNRLINFLKTFTSNEEGAVTTDWVMLCATLVAMALGVTAIMGPGATDHAGRIDGCLSGMSTETAMAADSATRAEAMASACNDAAAAS